MELTESSIFEEEALLEQAGSGKRLANYLIDIASFYALIFCSAFMLGYLSADFAAWAGTIKINPYLDRLGSLVLFGLYMAVVETVFKGKSLGKVFTRTRAVNEDGTNISIGTAFKRGFSRAVPFEAFSALGSRCYPWHDRWAKTYVVDEKKSVLITTM